VADRAARATGCHVVRLPQGYGLVPVTSLEAETLKHESLLSLGC
jgi:hypothetical protein